MKEVYAVRNKEKGWLRLSGNWSDQLDESCIFYNKGEVEKLGLGEIVTFELKEKKVKKVKEVKV